MNRLVELYDYRWSIHAREKQKLPPGNWCFWLINAGRGFGKTRTGAETVRIWKENNPIIHLVGATAGDVRDIMVEGNSGILDISPSWDKPRYEPSKRRLTWENGAKALLFSADEPDRLRGPQCYKAWADELAAWRYDEAWTQLKMGMRLGNNPQCIITTTPRPTKIIRELVKDEHTHLTCGTSYENIDNLAPAFFNEIIKMYEGTRIGRQELNAEILEDVEGALWNNALIEKNRWKGDVPDLNRIIIAVDPAVTSNPDSDETGIVVGGKVGIDGQEVAFILDDLSGILTPDQWAKRAVHAFYKHEADKIVAEVNQGGDLVEQNVRLIDQSVSYKSVRAFKGKYLRAEPAVALYEQGRVKHVGEFKKLEDEMTTWDATLGNKSPNRLDALVYVVLELLLGKKAITYFG